MLINADARHIPLADNTVQCVVTSPPYYGLRSYGIGIENGEIGLEQSPDDYVNNLVQVFREVRRILKVDGTVWLNIGDSYAGNMSRASNGGRAGFGTPREGIFKRTGDGLKPKDLIGIPWMVAFALRNDGWWLRRDIIWHKLNGMPESAKDRPTSAHEYVFLLTKSEQYYYDYEAILEPAAYDGRKDTIYKGSDKFKAETMNRVGGECWPNKIRGFKTKDQIEDNQHHGYDIQGYAREGTNIKGHSGYYNADGELNLSFDADGLPARNKRSVWSIPTEQYKGEHYAVMPQDLAKPCILAGSRSGDLIFDPFNGSGTTGKVAIELGRQYIGIDLNMKYLRTMAKKRTTVTMGLPI